MSNTPWSDALACPEVLLDKLYAKYAQLHANAERTSGNTRCAYHDKADGVLTAIRILEGSKHMEVTGGPAARNWVGKMRALIGSEVEVTIDFEKPVVVRGRLVTYNEGGECGLRDEEGLITWCWPALEVKRAGS